MYIDILILAELLSRPYHGYELKRQVEWILGDAFVINNNHLYPALRRFEQLGAITREVERQHGRPDRHIYHITERGKEELLALLRDFGADLARQDNEFQTRLAFFHLLDPDARVAILHTRQAVLRQRLLHRQQARARASEQAELRYALGLLDFQQQQIQQELDWIAALLKEVKP